MSRRKLFRKVLAFLSIPAAAKVCPESIVGLKCPLGHYTCRSIDKPLAFGNGDRYFPNVGQSFDLPLMMCDTCHVLFVDFKPEKLNAR